jgi:hypothetical protein
MPRCALAVTIASVSVLLVSFPALGAASSSGDLSTRWPRVSHLADGSTVSVWKSGHVVERDHRGRILSESWCESYAIYERWVAFIGSFQVALKRGETSVVARDIHYPPRWDGPLIASRRQLVSHYATVFRPGIVKAIIGADPRALFCQNSSEVALDDGVIWGDDFKGRLALITVNAVVP